MAKMYVDGMDAIQNALRTTEDGISEFVDDLLAAGGEIAKKKIEESITRHHHVRTGELLRSIKITKGKDKDGQKYSEVKATGKRERNSKGTANSYIAYVLNYGRSNYRGTHFWTEAEEQARKEYEELMEKKTEQYLKEKGLN